MRKPYLLAAVTILIWSTSATLSKLLLGALDSIQVLCVSALFSAVFWLITNTVTGNIRKLKTYTGKDYLVTLGIGLTGTFFYYLLSYTGTDLMPASQALIINYLWPIMSVVFACVLLKEKMTVRKVIAILISFLGVVVVLGKDLRQFQATALWGAGCCVLAAMFYGLFTALNQKFHYDKRLSMMLFSATTFLLTGLILVIIDSVPQLKGLQLVGLACNGTFNLAIATTTWAMALESGKTAKISNLAYITPFLSLIWTAVFLKEEITLFSLAGLVVIILGVFVQLKDKDHQ